MKKQTLSIDQMQHLQELELKLDYNTMLSWIVDERGKDKPLLCISSEAVDYVDFRHYCLPAYTLQDVLDALPTTILHDKRIYELDINMCNERIEYVKTSVDDVLVGLCFTQIPLIDAAYSMLCWAIDNKFVETNKNE